MTFVLNMSRTVSHNEVKFSKIKQKISKHSQDIDKIKTRQRQVESSLLPLHFQDMLPLRPLLDSNSNSTLSYLSWKHVETDKVISQDRDLVARGSSLSREFSNFFKAHIDNHPISIQSAIITTCPVLTYKYNTIYLKLFFDIHPLIFNKIFYLDLLF